MSKSKETFNKREREKKRQKAKEDKQERKQERKAQKNDGNSLDDMLAYVDENGNLSSTPPDPKKRKVFNVEDMNTGVPERVEEASERLGIVDFFNDEKGFGFIVEQQTKERIFVHNSQLTEPIRERDKVSFEIERGPKGLNAVMVKRVKA
jgi:cold shock CspA family protein